MGMPRVILAEVKRKQSASNGEQRHVDNNDSCPGVQSLCPPWLCDASDASATTDHGADATGGKDASALSHSRTRLFKACSPDLVGENEPNKEVERARSVRGGARADTIKGDRPAGSRPKEIIATRPRCVSVYIHERECITKAIKTKTERTKTKGDVDLTTDLRGVVARCSQERSHQGLVSDYVSRPAGLGNSRVVYTQIRRRCVVTTAAMKRRVLSRGCKRTANHVKGR
ncbi:hypothetical protein MTO96_022455 [Rhipicephalus appendiculatus]